VFDSGTSTNSGEFMIQDMVEELKILSLQLQALKPIPDDSEKRMPIMHAFYDLLSTLPNQDAVNAVLDLVNDNDN